MSAPIRIGLPFSAAKLSLPLSGMRDQHRRVLLEDRRDGDERQVLLHELDGAAAAEIEVEPASHHELHLVHLRPALADGHLQAVSGVDAGGDRLVVAAVFRLGDPVEAEADRRPRRALRVALSSRTSRAASRRMGASIRAVGCPSCTMRDAIGEVAWPSLG